MLKSCVEFLDKGSVMIASETDLEAAWARDTLVKHGLPADILYPFNYFIIKNDGQMKWSVNDPAFANWWTWENVKKHIDTQYHYVYENCFNGAIKPDFGIMTVELRNKIMKVKSKCDCGAAKVKTTHSFWCSTNKK